MGDDITGEYLIKKFQEDAVYYDTNGSEISKFYGGKCVFLTGGTGFLGKLILEKLLRACPDIGTVFLLARPKKGKDMHTRMDEICSDVIYEKLSRLQPKFRHKIVLVNGDVALPGLGMSIEDRKIITEKASIFIHSAATVRFHEKLNLAVDINVKGTKEMLILAKECAHFDSFVHIGTAFSHCVRHDVDESFYDVPLDCERLIRISDSTPPDILEKITPDLLDKWPNTYVFTKAVAEDCIRRYASQLPVCIVRPAVVIATYKEPIKSWIDNIYGATGIVVGSGLGIISVANIDETKIAEVVPADMVVNCVIAAGYKTATERKPETSIYNYVSSPQKPITWKTFMALNFKYGIKNPTTQCLWVYNLVLIPNVYWYYFNVFIFHIIPGLFMDAGLIVMGKKPQMISIYKKIHKFNDVIRSFGLQNWNFGNDNTQKLYSGLTEADKKLFFFDMAKLDWVEYYKTHCLGLRTFIVKEDLSTVPQAKRRYLILQIVNYVVKIVLVLAFLKLCCVILSWIF